MTNIPPPKQYQQKKSINTTRNNLTSTRLPNKSPMTRSGLPCRIPVMAAKMSTEPFPKATKVTPATFCESFKVLEIRNKAGQRLDWKK